MPFVSYRLKVSTMAITFRMGFTFLHPGQPIMVPAGAIVSVDVDDLRIGDQVQAKWAGRIVTMFTTDLKQRGEQVQSLTMDITPLSL